MSSFMRECDSGIWFNEEDPDDESYNPNCCTNVYLDNVCGKFDIIDYGVKYINIDDDYTYYKKAQKYLKLLENKFEPDCNDDDYNADSEN